MGWKSTKYISREEAELGFLLVKLMEKREKWLAKARLMSDEELGDALDVLGDDNPDLPSTYGWFGHNFLIGEALNDY